MTLKTNQPQFTAIKPQANAIIERIHDVFNYMLRSFDFKREFKKCVCKTIMSLKPNHLQVTTKIAQSNAIIEQVHKVTRFQ
jgi:hypothetical protein